MLQSDRNLIFDDKLLANMDVYIKESTVADVFSFRLDSCIEYNEV